MDHVRKCWIPADLGREDAAAVLDVPRGRLEGERKKQREEGSDERAAATGSRRGVGRMRRVQISWSHSTGDVE
ncbi:MAG: hypothetical protein AAGF12_04705 [Myxococcota bacterium]